MHSKRQNNQESYNPTVLPTHRPTVVAVFAHPDDEAFGPAGTLAKFANDHDVYLLCVTCGEAGENPKDLAKIRTNELLQSAKILGIKKVYFLDFVDGTLSNSLYHKLAQKIEEKLKLLTPETIMTFEPRGISGHIDHITVSMVTTYVFYKLPFIKTLLYHCITREIRNKIGEYFIYFPPGYRRSEIDKVVNIKDVWETKVKAMLAHQSQIADAKRILKMRRNLPKEEYFLVLEK